MNKELQEISQLAATALTENTITLLKTDLISQKNLLQVLYNQLNAITVVNGKIDKSYTVLLQNAYRAIMAARQFFTNESIGYRIYYSSSNNASSLGKSVKIFELTEEDILNITTLEGSTLRLKSTFTKALDNASRNSEREAIFDQHWNDMFSQLVQAEWTKQTAYRVIKPTYLKYSKMNPGLKGKSGKGYAAFNRGNLYESFDATAEDIYSNIVDIRESINSLYNKNAVLFEKKYFGQYLKHDQIKGFQTGDVGLVQLKARRAQIIEMTTLKSYLRDIIELLNTTEKLSDKQKLVEKIKTMFTDPEIEQLDPILEKHISKIADDICKGLNKN